MKARYTWLATTTVLALGAMLWPGAPSASADTTLGGYEATAIASVVHIQIFDPTIPIPSSPEVDGSLAYSSATVTSGPTTNALASYLWPGPVIGDGLSQLIKGANYPVQVNSNYPATIEAPANNTIQFTDGNGMTTSTNGFNTDATVTLLGIAGPGTNLGGGLGTGLAKLGARDPAKAPKTPTMAPLPVSNVLAGLVTAQNVTSEGSATVAGSTITSTAHAAASNLSLLGGIVKIAGFDATSTVVSNGSTATSTGDATIGAVSLLGLKLPIDSNGINLGLPVLSETVTNLLQALGISIQTLPVTKTVSGASGEFHAQVLVLTINTKPLKSIVNDVLSPIFAKLGKYAQTQLQPVLDLGPKIVLTIGESDATANASPAFTFPSGGGTTTGTVGGTVGTAGIPGTPGTPGTLGTAGTPGTISGAPGTTPASLVPTSSALGLPPLGEVPRALILGAILVAGVVGWFFRRAAAAVLGGAGKCGYGLVTGVPDLRRG